MRPVLRIVRLRSSLTVLAIAGIFALLIFGVARLARTGGAHELEPGRGARGDAPTAPGSLCAPDLETRAGHDQRRVVPVQSAALGSGRADGASLAAGTAPPSVIELHVFDAHSGAPLASAQVRILTVAALPASQGLTVLDDRWRVGPSPGGAPGMHIPQLPVIAQGSTPLRVTAIDRSMIWVTAPGYGWANVYLDGVWPGQVHVSLEATAGLDVIVSSRDEYTTALVDLDVYPATGEGGPTRVRRRVEGDVARFTGLPAGRLKALVVARHAERPDFPQAAIAEGTLSVGRTSTIRLRAAPIFGELELTLATPASASAPQRVDSIEVFEESLLALNQTRRPTIVMEFDESIENGRAVFRLREPLRVTAAPFEILVRPHGIRIRGRVSPEELQMLHHELPELVQRRIALWDTTIGAPFAGRLKIRLDEELLQPNVVFDRRAIEYEVAAQDGSAFLLPVVPFHFYTTPGMEWLQPELSHWTTGSAVPVDLRIELRVDPNLEEWHTLLEGQSRQSGRFGR